jgi:hypothetical protein
VTSRHEQRHETAHTSTLSSQPATNSSPPRARSEPRRAQRFHHPIPSRVAAHEHTSGGDRARCGREWGHPYTEDDVIRLAAHRPARATSIEAIAKTRWLTRCRVRMTVLLNPGSPPRVSVPLVGLCTRSELLELARATDVPTILRITANELADRRPPLFGENARDSEKPERLLQ